MVLFHTKQIQVFLKDLRISALKLGTSLFSFLMFILMIFFLQKPEGTTSQPPSNQQVVEVAIPHVGKFMIESKEGGYDDEVLLSCHSALFLLTFGHLPPVLWVCLHPLTYVCCRITHSVATPGLKLPYQLLAVRWISNGNLSRKLVEFFKIITLCFYC